MRIALALDKSGFDNDYVRSLRAAGAAIEELLHLPDDESEAARFVAELDGLVLGGGEDIEPHRYGEPVRATNLELHPARDARELAAYASARAVGLPVLAICRGLQLVNVARGGTLVQDIPTEMPDASVSHRMLPRDAEAHEILIDPGPAGAPLRRAFPSGSTRVNSRHHQAVARRAPDLVVAALAPDGIAEALAEKETGHEFFLAVQWHPENMPFSSGHGELFRMFVEACRSRAGEAAARLEREAAEVAS